MSKLKPEVRYSPEQLQARLDACGYQEVELTPAQHDSIDTLVNYRYAPVLENTGPYRKFVWAYLVALASDQPCRDKVSTIMNHAVTEMRRAHQHHGAK